MTCILVSLISMICYGQEKPSAINIDTIPSNSSIDNKNIELPSDISDESITVIDSISTEAEVDSIIGFFNIFKGEPGKAAFYGLMIPGGGQFYNRRWVKAPIAIIADATAIGVAIYWSRRYNIYTEAYQANIDGTLTTDQLVNVLQGVTSVSTLSGRRDTFRKYRDYSWFTVGIVHIITVVEAFVDRHLLEFDMDEDLSLEIISINDPTSITLASVNYRF